MQLENTVWFGAAVPIVTDGEAGKRENEDKLNVQRQMENANFYICAEFISRWV